MPRSKYQFSVEERPDYLYVHLTSDTVTEQTFRGYVTDIAESSEKAGLSRILVYRDIPEVMAAGEAYSAINDTVPKLRGKKLAIVNPYSENEKGLQFGVTVARNRGGNYAIFDSVTKAEEWLLA